MLTKNRAGTFIQQSSGYKSFVPSSLPPVPELHMDSEMMRCLSDADRKLGRLDGITEILPNPDLFVAMYVQKEALLSSQIEGTQASLSDILGVDGDGNSDNIQDVVNYVEAMNYGLERLKDFPLSLRLIKEIHEKLLEVGRGSTRNPGQFRATQNWIGPGGCTIQTASFVPPCVPDMIQSMNELEDYFYQDDNTPALIKIALIHAQFETIHPFLDGNGRMGRLLITFWLCQQKILSQPLLYLSYYFKLNRTEYYDRLMDVRLKGDWENWVKFFLKGVALVSDEATESAKSIIQLKNKLMELELIHNNINARNLLVHLFESPIISKNRAADFLGVSYPTASSTIDTLVGLKILYDITPDQQRNKRYMFMDYYEIMNKGTEL